MGSQASLEDKVTSAQAMPLAYSNGTFEACVRSKGNKDSLECSLLSHTSFHFSTIAGHSGTDIGNDHFGCFAHLFLCAKLL